MLRVKERGDRRRRDSEPRADRRGAGLPPADGEPEYLADVQQLDLDALRPRRRAGASARAALLALLGVADDRAASGGSTASTTTWCAPTRSTCPAWARASCASRAPTARWRCRSTATAATATSIRGAARCSRWPRRRATSRAPAREPLGGDQLPQLRQSRAAGDHVAVRAGRRGHRRGLPRARTCRSPAATSASTTRPTGARSTRRRSSASSACSRMPIASSTRRVSGSRATSSCCSARAAASSAAANT